MCGIWASLGLRVGKERIDRIAHRGPDGEGWREFASTAGPVVLGHRRLAIIDTSDAGAQPMSDPTGRYWLTYNGEIYNYLELRSELEFVGVTFQTRSDSEVLLQALIAWGPDALLRFNGMFAFVLWDNIDQTLLAARDRFGIKPLYMVAIGGGIAFASEIKQVYDLPGVSRRMNLRRVRDFLAAGVLDHSAETMFDGIAQLRGGQFVRIACGPLRSTPIIETWYQLPRPGSLKLPLDTAAGQFRDLFDDAIRLQLRADVPLGSCLSGGLDSSSIVAVAAHMLGANAPMTTISAVFDTARVDERRYMESVVTATGASARYVTVEPESVFSHASDIVWQQDEPYGSTSIHAQMRVFDGARGAGLKVMLDGQGADEPLAGYHAMFAVALAEHVRCGRLGSAIAMLRARERVHGSSVTSQLTHALPYLVPQSARALAQHYRRREDGGDWLGGVALRPFAHLPSPNDAAARDLGRPGAVDLATFTAMQTMTTSLPMLLHWEDRSSMAYGVEARVPFLDHRLVELAIGLGSAHKIDGALTKVLLRSALGPRLPPLVRDRQDKIGFATPEEEWFLGPLAADVRRAIGRTLDLYPALLDRRATLAYVDAVLGRRRPFDFTLWRIACLGVWGERFGLAM